MVKISATNLVAAILYALATCTAVRSITLGGRVFDVGERKVEDKFVTDPSANVTGKLCSYSYLWLHVLQ